MKYAAASRRHFLRWPDMAAMTVVAIYFTGELTAARQKGELSLRSAFDSRLPQLVFARRCYFAAISSQPAALPAADFRQWFKADRLSPYLLRFRGASSQRDVSMIERFTPHAS